MDNYAKAELYRNQAQRSRNQAIATEDASVRTIMLLLADQYEELANSYLRLAVAEEKRKNR